MTLRCALAAESYDEFRERVEPVLVECWDIAQRRRRAQ